jgi:hypothetical protein
MCLLGFREPKDSSISRLNGLEGMLQFASLRIFGAPSDRRKFGRGGNCLKEQQIGFAGVVFLFLWKGFFCPSLVKIRSMQLSIFDCLL